MNTMRKFLIVAAGLFIVTFALPEVRAHDEGGVSLGDVGSVLDNARDSASAIPSASAAPITPDDPWKRVKLPTRSGPEAIGGYSAGCVRGALALEITGNGFQVMRLSRRRWFGHPKLLNFIRGFASTTRTDGLGSLLIGDMAQPRGGPTLSGHASHQTGLDVDIWYLMTTPGKILSPEEREKLSSPSLVKGDFDSLTKNWSPKVMDLLRDASTQPNVERIFVNPAIKKEICARHGGEPWLGKLRPWWGHADHFHVRLHCPSGDSQCRDQEDVPAGDGCGSDLASWFTPARREEAKRMKQNPSPPTMPTLPPLCAQVLQEPPL